MSKSRYLEEFKIEAVKQVIANGRLNRQRKVLLAGLY
jgi:hypothetical protein